MNKNTNLFLCWIFLLTTAVGEAQFKAMYCQLNFGDKKFEDYLDNIIEVKINDKENFGDGLDGSKKIMIKRLILDELGKFPGALSLCESGDGSKFFGLFYNTQLHGQFPPFFRVLAGGKIGGDLKKRSVLFGDDINSMGDYRAEIMNQAQLKVLDLNDAYVEIDDLLPLTRVKSLRFLAMSSRGMRYDKPFSFPESITHLVVRNAELTPQFFQAIQTIKNLEYLEIDRCVIRKNYDWPTPTDRNQLMDQSINNPERNNPFENMAKNLRVLTITQSDPVLFEHFNVLAWPKLTNLNVDIFLDSDFFKIAFHKKSLEFRKKFPDLEKVKLSFCDVKLSEDFAKVIKANNIIGLSFQLELQKDMRK